jgi:hypothetical protein
MTDAPTVLFAGKGRLGNQLFQWAALSKQFPRSDVWSTTLTSLPEVLEPVPRLKTVLPSSMLDLLLRKKRGRKVLRTLFKHARLGSYAWEPVDRQPDGHEWARGKMLQQPGLFRTTFVDGGYYQNLADFLAPSDFGLLRVRASLLQQATSAINEIVDGDHWPQIVMHVRRTDYLHFRPFGLDDVTLPTAYFEKAAAQMRITHGTHAPLLIVTDDKPWCLESLDGLKPFHLLSSSEALDFAALTMFESAVISNSTYSLAAACMGPTVQRVIAPHGWFGHRVGRWLPHAICSSDQRFTYI